MRSHSSRPGSRSPTVPPWLVDASGCSTGAWPRLAPRTIGRSRPSWTSRPARRALVVKDGQALEAAVAAVIQATAREAGDAPVVVRASVRRDREPAVEVVVGPRARLPAFAEATAGQDAGSTLWSDDSEEFAIGRGGMGLSLVLATVVLDAHAARVWTAAGNRSIAGIRLPVAAEEQ